MIGKLLLPELTELVEKREFNRLREVLMEFPAVEVAEILGDLSAADKAVLLRILPNQLATEVFDHLPLGEQEELVQALGNEQVARILNDLPPDDRTALLEELPPSVTQKLLDLLTPEERRVAVELLGYPEDSIGRLMTPRYVAIRNEWKVGEVLEFLRGQEKKRDTLNLMFVVDQQGCLINRVRLRDLVVAAPSTPVSELFEENTFALHPKDDQETAVEAFRKYDVSVLPVVNANGVLLGAITVDDILDVAQEESTEDMQKLGGMEAIEEPYLKTGMTEMVRKRAGWLAVLFVGEMFTASAMGYFEGEIERAVVLALFVPLIISSGGNSGSQATSLVIRSLAVGELKLSDWWRVLKRELIAGTTLGAVLAIVGVIRILVWQKLGLYDYGVHYGLIAITIGFSLVGVVLFGSLMGSMLPFLLRRLGFDPAVSSAPFVATLVDVTGLVIYFTTAWLVLHGTLL